MDRYGRLERSRGLARRLRVRGWCIRGMYLDRPGVVSLRVRKGGYKYLCVKSGTTHGLAEIAMGMDQGAQGSKLKNLTNEHFDTLLIVILM